MGEIQSWKGRSDAETLAIWLYDLAKVLCTVANPPRATKQNERKSEKIDENEKATGLEHVNVHVHQSNEANTSQQRPSQETNQKRKFPCLACGGNCDKMEDCSKFKSFNVDARWKAMIELKLCRRCLRKHRPPCRSTAVCGKNGCQYKHHLLLHNDERHTPPESNPKATPTLAPSNFHSATNMSTMLRIVPVILYNGTKSVRTFAAFFDDGTTVTMMEKRLADELGLSGTSEQICLIWTKNIHRQEKAERVSLEISGINGFDKRYTLKGVRTVDDLHLPVQSMNKSELAAKYPYLKNVPLVDYTNITPGIMIGSDMPNIGTQLQVVESSQAESDDFNGPIATRTRLGWSVHGPRIGSRTNEFINVHQFEVCPHHNEVDDDIHQRVKDHFSVKNFGVEANSKIALE